MATTTLLAVKSLMMRYMGQLWAGTATGGSITSLVDTSLIDLGSDAFPFPLEDKQLRITSGASLGDLRRIVKVDHATGTISVNRAFSSTGPAAATTYEIWGNSINGGTQLTNLFNDVLQVARPLTQTQLTIVTGEKFYDVTTLVTSPEDIVEVYVRSLDPTSLVTYNQHRVFWWNCYPLITAELQALTLEIDCSLTEIWVEHYKKLADFTADTSTLDATYQEWLAWEAVMRHALSMQNNNTDKGRWNELAKQAAAQVTAYRQRFMPRKPRRTMHGRPQVM